MKRIGLLVAAVIGCAIVAVGLAEIVVRSMARPGADWPRRAYQVRQGYTSFRPNAELTFTNERKQQIPIEVDERGFRNYPGRFVKSRFLLLGDSFTAAVNTRENETVAGRLRAAGYVVYNGGSDGSGTFHQLAILEDALAERRFDAVVLLFYTGNDFHDNFMTPEPLVTAAAKRATAPTGSNIPGAVGSDIGAIAARPPWRQAVLNVCRNVMICQQIYHNFWLGQIRGYARDPWTSPSKMRLHLLTDGHFQQIDKALERTRIALSAMKGLATSKGARLLVVSVPSRGETMQSWYDFVSSPTFSREQLMQVVRTSKTDFDRMERLIRNLCKELELPYHALLPDMRKAPVPSALYGVVDGHWMAAGQAVGARSIAGFLDRSGLGPAK